MKMIKNNMFTILSLAIVCVFAMTGGVCAADAGKSSIETTAITKMSQIFAAARNVMFVVGGFGLIAVAFLAITGKMNWKWVGQLAIGLGIIAAASAVIEFVIDTDVGDKSEWKDTLS